MSWGACRAALLSLLAAGCLAACTSNTGAHTADKTAGAVGAGVTSYPASARTLVPPISAKTLDGRPFTVSDYQGSVTVINVWASWCGPCRAESPMLAKLAVRTGRTVRFVGIDEADRASAAQQFTASAGVTYPQLSDPDGTVLAHLKVLPTAGIPMTVVLDRHQRMAGRIIGPATESDLLNLIRQADST